MKQEEAATPCDVGKIVEEGRVGTDNNNIADQTKWWHSARSWASLNAYLGAYSLNVFLAVLCLNACLSILSLNTFCSILSLNSAFSILSVNSFFAIGCRGKSFAVCI